MIIYDHPDISRIFMDYLGSGLNKAKKWLIRILMDHHIFNGSSEY